MITNTKNLPLPIVAAIQNDDHISQGSDLGASTVSAPVRQVALRKRHRGEIVEDASERIWSLFGQAMHVVLERAGKDPEPDRRKIADAIQLLESLSPDVRRSEHADSLIGSTIDLLSGLLDLTAPIEPASFTTFREERWETEVLGWKIAARCDHLTLDGEGTLTDYKVSSVWSVKDGEPKDEWVSQLNVTRYCGYMACGLNPQRLQATVFLRDWRKNERLRYGDEYPELQVATVPVPLWSIKECRAYLEERTWAHATAQQALERGEDIPACSPTERWERPTTYAVTKKGRKTAVRLYGTSATAYEHARSQPDLTVVVRPGASVRCQQYCDVLPFCSQGQKLVAQMTGDSDS